MVTSKRKAPSRSADQYFSSSEPAPKRPKTDELPFQEDLIKPSLPEEISIETPDDSTSQQSPPRIILPETPIQIRLTALEQEVRLL